MNNTTPSMENWNEQLKTLMDNLVAFDERLPGKITFIGGGYILLKELEDFIYPLISQAKQQAREDITKNVGMLRQWLNEECITDNKRLVSNEDILHWLTPQKEEA